MEDLDYIPINIWDDFHDDGYLPGWQGRTVLCIALILELLVRIREIWIEKTESLYILMLILIIMEMYMLVDVNFVNALFVDVKTEI